MLIIVLEIYVINRFYKLISLNLLQSVVRLELQWLRDGELIYITWYLIANWEVTRYTLPSQCG